MCSYYVEYQISIQLSHTLLHSTLLILLLCIEGRNAPSLFLYYYKYL
jgi:hypothetical protein